MLIIYTERIDITPTDESEERMARDCEQFSPNAQTIFRKLEPFFRPDPWNKPRWTKEGEIFDNGWFDLRKGADRERLATKNKVHIGHLVEMEASMCRKDTGSLSDFTRRHFTQQIQICAAILLILSDLDFQIETMDIVEECQRTPSEQRACPYCNAKITGGIDEVSAHIRSAHPSVDAESGL